jgi:hypothetical protein
MRRLVVDMHRIEQGKHHASRIIGQVRKTPISDILIRLPEIPDAA